MAVGKRTLARHLLLWACTLGLLAGCGRKAGSVKVDSATLSSLADETDILASATMEQRKTMYRILRSLDELSSDAYALENDREQNQSLRDTSMANRITAKLKAIGREIDEARELAADNVQLLEMLDELKRTVSEREAEIARLRTVKWVKKDELDRKIHELRQKNADLQDAQATLRATHERLLGEEDKIDDIRRQTWLDVGDKLVESADETQVVKKRGKLVKGVREANKRILRRAIKCYETAGSMGAPSASQKISNANAKLRQLEGE
ncbi:MAG: hypothetical protein K5945_11555 [Bacteroidaceae bacterium]|nr:hypothetical protein [Bacteroidaceae bacterium]